MGSAQSTVKADKPPKARSVSASSSDSSASSTTAAAPPAAVPSATVTPASPPPAAAPVTQAGDQALPEASESDLAEVEAATRQLLDTRGGQALEILLSPAVKKPKSRLSPPTSPAAALTQADIALKLKEAEERRRNIEAEKIKSLAAQLAKVNIAQQKKEEVVKERVEKTQEAMRRCDAADEKKAKNLSEVKGKVSEHMGKIEKAQKELEAARLAAESSLHEKEERARELKNQQMEDMLRKIKEHQEHGEKVRNGTYVEVRNEQYVEELQVNIKAKEERAREIRETKEAEVKNKLAEANKRADAVRQNKKLQQESGNQTNESA